MKNYKIAFSPGIACKELIINSLRLADSTIEICVFTISDDAISGEIKEAYDRGVDVRIITDNYKVYDEGSDVEELSLFGIPVRVDTSENQMHHKFMIVDQKSVLTGSYNWTRSAALYNQENLVKINDAEFCVVFQQEFDRLWTNLVDLEVK
jgi:phosphatidylserine/phosphatidylglycerophosphate/cardiolipin synthase-like enzyme